MFTVTSLKKPIPPRGAVLGETPDKRYLLILPPLSFKIVQSFVSFPDFGKDLSTTKVKENMRCALFNKPNLGEVL